MLRMTLLAAALAAAPLAATGKIKTETPEQTEKPLTLAEAALALGSLYDRALDAVLALADADGDGQITKDEMAEAMKLAAAKSGKSMD